MEENNNIMEVNNEEYEIMEMEPENDESNANGGALVLTALISAGIGFAAAKLGGKTIKWLKKKKAEKDMSKTKSDADTNRNSDSKIHELNDDDVTITDDDDLD